jgi:hypothetical protein
MTDPQLTVQAKEYPAILRGDVEQDPNLQRSPTEQFVRYR